MTNFNCLTIFLFVAFGFAKADLDPVAFTAVKGSTNGNYVAFHTLVVNNKADFTPTYGAFKCTKPGIYFFSFSAVCPASGDLRISLRSNGVPVVTIYTGGSRNFESATGSGLLELTEGDLVYLYVEKGEIYESNKISRAFTTFSGFQISEIKSKSFFSRILGRNGQTNIGKDPNDNLQVLLNQAGRT